MKSNRKGDEKAEPVSISYKLISLLDVCVLKEAERGSVCMWGAGGQSPLSGYDESSTVLRAL